MPNQMIAIGASATMGIEPSAMMNGCTKRETKREYQRESPMVVPITLPSTKPAKVSDPVSNVSFQIVPSFTVVSSRRQISWPASHREKH